MSRSQSSGAGDTAKKESSTYYDNSQNSYAKAQSDVGDYEKSLGDYAAATAKFRSQNPFAKGGQVDTANNQMTANTSDAAARAAGEVLQGQALRTGENSAGAIAATERMQEQGTRDLSADQAKLNSQRVGEEAQYNAEGVGMQGDVTKATEFPVQAETTLSGQQGNLTAEQMRNELEAYRDNNSFSDQFGGAFAKGLGSASAKFLMG